MNLEAEEKLKAGQGSVNTANGEEMNCEVERSKAASRGKGKAFCLGAGDRIHIPSSRAWAFS